MQLQKIFIILGHRGSYIRSSPKIKLLHKHWKIVAYLINFLLLQIENDQLTITADPQNIDDK